jgi:hypothetical protein
MELQKHTESRACGRRSGRLPNRGLYHDRNFFVRRLNQETVRQGSHDFGSPPRVRSEACRFAGLQELSAGGNRKVEVRSTFDCYVVNQACDACDVPEFLNILRALDLCMLVPGLARLSISYCDGMF